MEQGNINKTERDRLIFFQTGPYERVNKIVCYGVDNADLHIHIAPAGDCTPVEIGILLNDGLKKIAEIVAKTNENNVVEISMTSQIVAEKEEIFKKMGFTIEENIETKIYRLSAIILRGDKRKIKSASMSREKFLEKFNKKINHVA